MRVRVLTAVETVVDAEATSVTAETLAGSVCVKPGRLDFVAGLRAGVMSYVSEGAERFVGVGEGVIVKAGEEVLVAAHDAAPGERLGEVEAAVRERLASRAGWERETREAGDRLEATLARRFVELEEERRETS